MKKFLSILTITGVLIGNSFSTNAQDTPAKAAAPAAVKEAAPAPPAPAAPPEAVPAAPEGPGYKSYEEFTKTPGFAQFTVNNLWILIAAALVFIMHLGFATVETGLTQSKNTVNILFKNVFIICMGVLTYALWGFNAMYPGDSWTISKFFAIGGMIPSAIDAAGEVKNLTATYNAGYTIWGDFIFQAMFAATAATIVSGAVAERIKLSTFMVGATILVMFGYPITGSWEWGGGWLSEPFADFAGSSLVHAFGGYAALAVAILLGPRKGKYIDGKIRPIPGHSMPLAAIGVFMLFLGWFGFNGGSVLSADPQAVSRVFVTTTLAGCAGGLAAAFTSWIVLRKPDLSMALNGILAGLVGITAGADVIGIWASVLVGGIAGIIVVFSVLFFDKLKIDDPVGAISVHGVCGNWGTIAVGIFGGGSLKWQVIGTFSISAFAFVFALVTFGILKAVMGLRVSPDEEAEGLDIAEHGMEAYPHFATEQR